MKLLVVIPCNTPGQLKNGSVKWAARAGFKLKLFANKGPLAKYQAAIEDINYNYYVDLRHDMLVHGKNANPLAYAQEKGYDLLAVIPSKLKAWNKTKDDNLMVIEFQADMARARKKIGKDPTLHEVTFSNGTRVVRVVRL